MNQREMSAIVGNLIRPIGASNDSLWRLVPNATSSSSAALSLSNSANFVSLPTSVVTVAPFPYSVQYTPATNCVFTVSKAGFYQVVFSGAFSNGSSPVANNYASVCIQYTQGTTTISEQGTVLPSPGSFSYNCQSTVNAYFAVGDTITPLLQNYSGNTMQFNMRILSIKYSPC